MTDILIRGERERERETPGVHMHREEAMWPSASQGERPQEKPNLPTP